MRILLINKFYYRRGGDCIYMLNLEQLLRSRGHEVAVFAMDYPDNLDSPWRGYFPSDMSAAMALTRPFGSREVRRQFGRLLRDFRPDVVHLNNIHTQLSPVVAEMAHRRGVRVVWTLHDYKLLCPRYDCLRGGVEVCESCHGGRKRGCLTHRCMKGSLLASAVGYAEALAWHRRRLEVCTDAFICPSRFMAKKMAGGGFSAEKLHTLCNFIDVDRCHRFAYDKGDYYCYVGRLSHEKGVRTLITAANRLPDHPLTIVGDGPLMDELHRMAGPHIRFVGHRSWDELKVIVGRSRFTVVPSEWYENNPLSVIEAQCLGTPVLGARIGGVPELIDEGQTGMTFESRNVDDLHRTIAQRWNARFDYARIAHTAMERYDAGAYYDKLMAIYPPHYRLLTLNITAAWAA